MGIIWKKNGYQFNADPEKAYSELQTLGDNFKPEDVVKFAEDESTELHKCFTWDNTIAAAKWRKFEARQVLCCLVQVDDDKPEKNPESIRVFYSIAEDRHYESTQTIVKNQDTYSKLLAQAWKELQSFKAKYSMLSELDEIFRLIA